MTDNGGAKKGFIHQVLGNDQKAIEGFDSADAELRHSLAQELAEKNAKIEFDGAVRTVPLLQVPEGIEPEAPNDVGNAELDGQKADPEGEDDFDTSQFERLGLEVRRRAKELLSKLRSTLSLGDVNVSLHKRGEKIVEAAVKNDNRPESSFAAHNAGSIYRDGNGALYETKGASSALSLLRSVGPPEIAVDIPLPDEYPSTMGYSWKVIDECYTPPIPNSLVFIGTRTRTNRLGTRRREP